jgi:putative ABC transport system ATP-binding protein
VTKDYPKGRGVVQALRGVDVEVADGEWLAIQGPTGHGKTTLLQMLGGLDRPTSGGILLGADNLARLREGEVTRVRATSIGFIFQTFNLVPTLSAQEDRTRPAAHPFGRAPCQGVARARRCRPRGSRGPPAVGTVRRATAASRHCPGAG